MARFLNIFLLCLILPVVFGQCNINKAKSPFRRAVYEFSVDLLSRLSQDNEGHFVASTLSPWTLLAAVSFGAAGETLAEIKRVAKLYTHKCFNKHYLELVKEVTSTDPYATIERSSSLFIDETMQLKENFKQRLSDTGVCNITPVSFDDFSAAAANINSYVKEATHGIIDEIVSPNELEGVYLMIIDAFYFKGTWQKSFSPVDTEVSVFYDAKRNPLGDVNLMFMNAEVNLTDISPIQANVLELPYGNSGKFSMLLFLPYEDVTLNSVINSLKKVSLESIFRSFKREGYGEVMVQIPRFKMSTDIDNFKELLTDMGLKDMFDSSKASFPDISNYELYVSSFVQKAEIEVNEEENEEGTEATSATSMGLVARSFSEPLQFQANKPFLYMVVNRELLVPIFSGAYSKPTIY